LQQAYSAAVVVMFDRRESARNTLITALAEARGTLSNAKHAGTLGPAEEAERIQNLTNSFLMLAEKCLDEKSLAAAVDPRLQLENFEALGETRDGLTELATQLGDTRRDAFQEKLQRYRASAESLRWLMASLLGLLGLALAGAATLVYRAVVLPMKGRLNSAEESMRVHENLVALGTLAAGLAYEIRNPLTAIKARLFALGELIDKDSPAENQTRVIKREIERLEQTVQDFLDYAKPKAPNPVSTALQPYLEDLRTLVLPEMREREIGFSLGDPTELKVMMDREQVTQVMLNLIRNAEEACKPGDRIVVTSSEHEGKVRLSVMDNGPGIPVEHRERVFEPFFSNKKGGTGLGLAICRTIAVAHRGNLEFETETGRGTTFYFDLPRTV
ncbi:MAG: sensor histidine kinase, partial [Verrucomicrobiales bacterium]